jgi:hypothetical protein
MERSMTFNHQLGDIWFTDKKSEINSFSPLYNRSCNPLFTQSKRPCRNALQIPQQCSREAAPWCPQ